MGTFSYCYYWASFKLDVEKDKMLNGCIYATGTLESKAEGPVRSMTKVEMGFLSKKDGKVKKVFFL